VRNPYAIRRPVANTYLVRQRDRRLRRDLLAMLFGVLVIAGGLLAYTWVHIEILNIGYRVDDLEKELERLRVEERWRRLELSYLTQPSRIEERARRELGMRAPELDQTLFYEELER
jgi:cell division protein FtsL